MHEVKLHPGDTIGILGGGQLGRMLALAAARLGLKCLIFAPEADSPAFQVTADPIIAAYDDQAALNLFASRIKVATYEFENVPVESVQFLEALIPVRPGSKALGIAQDRILEKQLAREFGAMTADFASIDDEADLREKLSLIGIPSILKTRRFGYDGKGQARIRSEADIASAYAAMRGQPAILEAFVPFELEVSVIAARALDGAFAAFDVTQNEHRNGILHRSIAPARIRPAAAVEAIDIARKMAEAMDYVGVFAVEFFAEDLARREMIRVNEIAPRVHNSGHWTQAGAATDQFEQHIRAIAGWPLGATRMRSRRAEMINLIGDDVDGWQKLVQEPGTQLHLYGKAEARAGRKMGHVNRLLQSLPK
jgi:5-(carboxyamino)imidazole ribonucleotide synthase